MARQFNSEHEARLAGFIEPKILEINGEKVTTIEKCLEKNSDGKFEWFAIVSTWCSEYWCSEDGEVLDRFEDPDEGYESNCHCDTYGICGGYSCSQYFSCHA